MKLEIEKDEKIINSFIDSIKWQELLNQEEITYTNLMTIFEFDENTAHKIIEQAKNNNLLMTYKESYLIADVPNFFAIINKFHSKNNI